MIFLKIFVCLNSLFLAPTPHKAEASQAKSLKRKRCCQLRCNKIIEDNVCVGFSFIFAKNGFPNQFLNESLNRYLNGFRNKFSNRFLNEISNGFLNIFWNGLPTFFFEKLLMKICQIYSLEQEISSETKLSEIK